MNLWQYDQNFFGKSLLIVAVFMTGLLIGCENRQRTSILVLAVDSLPLHPSICSREGGSRSGFAELCHESIRFSHAMTTSPLSLPALASVLTGLYPIDHGVHTNGAPGLQPHASSAAELALRQGYRTAFFSGGAPVFRRSGLHQGFEVFDDNMGTRSGLEGFFRPLKDNANLFLSWVKDNGSAPFFSVLYIPDLNFTNTSTETELGEIRSFAYESQMDELDTSLGQLIQGLKNLNRWDKTLVVLVGLNGRQTTQRPEPAEALVLNSENTQVTLLMKPPLKPRDQGINWQVDRNVSLVDLGQTLIHQMNGAPPRQNPLFPSLDLSPIFLNPEPSWSENRPILIESGWAQWHSWGGLRASIVEGHNIFLFDKKPVFYNSLVDQFEQNPIELKISSPQYQHWSEMLEQVGYLPFDIDADNSTALVAIPSLDWLLANRRTELAQKLRAIAKNNSDRYVLSWAALLDLELKDWTHLKHLSTQSGNLDWRAIALRNLGQVVPFTDTCLALIDLRQPSKEKTKTCQDELFLSLYHWRFAKNFGIDPDSAKKTFFRQWKQHLYQQKIYRYNVAMGLSWQRIDTENILPSRTDLALTLPLFRQHQP